MSDKPYAGTLVTRLRNPNYLGQEGMRSEAADEIERLNGIIKGVEIALARDEDIKSAMKIILYKDETAIR